MEGDLTQEHPTVGSPIESELKTGSGETKIGERVGKRLRRSRIGKDARIELVVTHEQVNALRGAHTAIAVGIIHIDGNRIKIHLTGKMKGDRWIGVPPAHIGT